MFDLLQKEMEENSSFGAADKVEPESEEIVLPKFIQVAKRVYDENWVRISGSICHEKDLCD